MVIGKNPKKENLGSYICVSSSTVPQAFISPIFIPTRLGGGLLVPRKLHRIADYRRFSVFCSALWIGVKVSVALERSWLGPGHGRGLQ